MRRSSAFHSLIVLALVTALVAIGDARGNGPNKPLTRSPPEVEAGVAAYKQKDYDKAYRLLAPWAERGDRWAQYHLGHMFEKGEGRAVDQEQAIKWYRKSAEAGYARAQYKVAAGYIYGYGSVPQNEAKAREWLMKSAEGGYRRAQRILAEAYRRGELGLPRDAEKAAYWAQQAER